MINENKNKNIDLQINNTLQLINKVFVSYLNMSIGKSKFKGKIILEINCTDGGIGNVSVNVVQNFNEKTIDNINF